ncbi:hypothetical protein D9M73_296790 [compost metagenome]
MGWRARCDELAVDDEHQVEQCRLGLTRNVDVPVDIDAGIGGQLRVQPQVVAAWPTTPHRQRAQFELSFWHVKDILIWPRLAARRQRMNCRTGWLPGRT